MRSKALFVVWASFSPRAKTMAAELGGWVSFQYESQLAGNTSWSRSLRWLVQGWRTWRLLEHEQPELIFVQTPPIFAPFVVALWCRLRGKTHTSGRRARYIIDGHTGAFHHPNWRWALPLLRLLTRGAVATLVTDEAALHLLQSWQARGFFLIDGLPKLYPPAGDIGSQGETRIAIINTFSDVEPVEELFAAARLLPQITFYLTGDARKASATLLEQRPENVILTGFLHNGTYTALLQHAHGLVILSREANDLSCGAYEALVMGKPAVVSNGPGMLRFFPRGFIHVAITPEAIADGIQRMLNSQEAMTEEVIAMRSELVNQRQLVLEEFVNLLMAQQLLPPLSLQAPMYKDIQSLERF